MFEKAMTVALFILTLSILISIYRLYKGPSMPDRVMALDSIGIHLISGVAIFSVLFKSHAFLDIILLLGILSFIGTIAFARFIERGVVIERGNDK
ncbi:Na(+)/H(+) antiporter subunit F1 [Pradoshia sp. D12]|uniref:Na(+)/H(+) antiporter subunit F1 n=1 Tax=Bacillaceae TaxID=186817 RepID=UPI00080AEE72|nr:MULTISPECIES: Na(+)/H(+) antiporter subunit F1 [Bacillaceae]OCA81121.1 Na(+)/H(+) antiporter subunit F [Bacillus sp. FJAT-27986]QFK73053.1 Na(+)/H(+) antiporter subunit F1 [Pradoshia sp. D12]TPF72045.1 Na(+)/H(+) antiporter subunit F1 [Bacillus sp. D12]